MSVLLSVTLSGLNSGADPVLVHTGAPKPSTTALPAIAAAPARTPSATIRVDQVQVSKQSQALLLYSQGQSVSDIGATLGLPETTVTSYLGITEGTQTVLAAATAAVDAEQTTSSSVASA